MNPSILSPIGFLAPSLVRRAFEVFAISTQFCADL